MPLTHRERTYFSRKFRSLDFVRERILWIKYLYGVDSHWNLNELKNPRVNYERVPGQNVDRGPQNAHQWPIL